MEDRVRALGEIAHDVLERLVRELLARKPGGHLAEPLLDELDLRIRLALRGAEADPRRFAEQLAATVERLVDDAVERAAAFRPGHTFCHRCAAAACDHSQPAGSRHVFVGYGPTGAPRWEDFAQHCLDLRHPEVDRLYDDPPAFLTLLHGGAELRNGLLDAFSTPAYQLLGQVSAGFFQVPVREVEGRGVLALSFQVAASRPRSGRARLGMNVLGRAPSGEDLTSLWERQREPRWRRAVRWAQSALATVRLPRQPRAAESEDAWVRVEQRAEAILRGLARRLERDHRARGRRTRHAERRHVSGGRPTRKAIDDARDVATENVLVDERSRTLVILGDRGRTHFFTPEGRLVSSVRYSRDAIARKRKLGLWREASPGEVAALREHVAEAPVAD